MERKRRDRDNNKTTLKKAQEVTYQSDFKAADRAAKK
ncbi:YfhE family protein [Alkalihalobacterium bogoriense]|nr:YfhE family protein [Alkalihalobacterium bogoriense]